MKKRVYELAKELNMETKKLLEKLQDLDFPQLTNLSSLDGETVEIIKELLNEEKNKGKEKNKEKINDESKVKTNIGNNSKENQKDNKNKKDNSKNNIKNNDKDHLNNDDLEGDDSYEEEYNNKNRRNKKKKNNNFRKKDNDVKEEKIVENNFDEIRTFTIPAEIKVKDLSDKLGIGINQIITKLIKLGVMVNQNQNIDFDLAQNVAEEFNIILEKEVPKTEEELLELDFEDTEESKVLRPPVVTVMGHVDHGKTSLLDAIRSTRVQVGEAGGITQRIGAYTINIKNHKIVFLDTPGHEAFTSMRARGAQITDISVIVVAADDGIMPQTKEAISHSKAAGVPIIVAINKIDKDNANVDRIRQELTEIGLMPESWGGDTITVEVSAKKNINIDELLEMILLVAELEELKANPNRKAMGTVIEAQLDKGQGPTATVLVQKGTLKKGDYVVSGAASGKIRLMIDDKGKGINKATPSIPVKIIGLSDVPEAGELFYVVETEKKARSIAEMRREKLREKMLTDKNKVSLEDLFDRIKEGKLIDLNIILKADNRGSIEAISQSLLKLSNEEVKVSIIHDGVGGISESDVMLASASNAIIIGFNVRPNAGAIELASSENVDIKTYRVIYDLIEDVEKAVKGLLAPKFKEVILGRATVRATFRLPNGQSIAGIYVENGRITRNSNVRLLRNDVVIYDGSISSLKRFKDDIKDVTSGYEAGLGLESYNDIKEGDSIEAYENTEIKEN